MKVIHNIPEPPPSTVTIELTQREAGILYGLLPESEDIPPSTITFWRELLRDLRVASRSLPESQSIMSVTGPNENKQQFVRFLEANPEPTE